MNLPVPSRGEITGTIAAGKLWNGLLGTLLVVAVILVYHPVWHAGFIWDDDEYVINNKLLTAPDGLWRIWFSLDSPSQYFPLTYTVFRFEYALWGLNPAGYHWVNLLLHAGNALLIWWLLRRLAVPGAWLAAAIWALHPVQVESVAWITELKNILMCCFFVLTLHAWVSFVEEDSRRRWVSYSLALMLYALALSAKTTACTLPTALLLVLWWQKRPTTRARLAQVTPFLILGLGMGLVTVWWERFHIGTHGQQFAIGPMQRILLASHAIWFYVGKLMWPVNLVFSYPRWIIKPTDPFAYFWLVATMGLAVAVYRMQPRIRRGVGIAILFFVATLSPMLGFIMLYTFLYTFVADHYQYVASLGLIALAAAGFISYFNVLKPRLAWFKPVLCTGLLGLLSVLTWRQCSTYSDIETLWRATIARNPGSWLAHFDLAAALVQKDQLAEAVAEYQATLKINPNYAPGHCGLGMVLSRAGYWDAAIAQYQQALQIDTNYENARISLGNALFQIGNVDGALAQFREVARLNPHKAEAHNNLGTALAAKGRMDDAINEFRAALQIDPRNAEAWNNLGSSFLNQGRVEEATVHFQTALKIKPNYPQALNTLAWVLSTAREPTKRDGQQAVKLAEQASQLTNQGNPTFLRTLAAAYAEEGHFPEAIQTVRQAGTLAEAQSNHTLASALLDDLKLYQSGRPFPRN
jgi:tetratricopeptide (TPR) repeat protein